MKLKEIYKIDKVSFENVLSYMISTNYLIIVDNDNIDDVFDIILNQDDNFKNEIKVMIYQIRDYKFSKTELYNKLVDVIYEFSHILYEKLLSEI